MVLYDALFVDGNTYTVSITTTEPGAPQSVTATGTSGSQVTLGWSAPSSIGGSAITGYKYRYKASGAEAFGDWTAISNSASLTSHVVGGLEANTAYTFQMLATNDSGDGLYSGEVTARLAGEAEQLAVTLVLDSDRIDESDGVCTVTATLNRTSTVETTITVSASAVFPATDSDFTLSSNTVLTIAAGATTSTGTVTISAVNNTADDDNRQVTVSGTVANTEGATAPAAMTLTIADDESASTKVTLTVSPTSVAEDAAGSDRTVTVTAELDGDPWPQATEVTVSVSGGSAVAGTDYTAVPDFTFTIAPGDTSGTGTFSLAPVDDILDETPETVTVMGTTNTGLSVEPASGLTVTIEDNDDPFVSKVNEDGSVTLYTGTLTIGATAITTDSLGFRRIGGVLEGTLSPETFTYGGDSYRISRLLTDSGGGSISSPGELGLGDLVSRSLSTAESLAHWVLHLDSHTFAFADADDKGIGRSFIDWYGVTNASLGWSAGQQVAVKIVRPPLRVALVLDPGVIDEANGVSTVTATLDKTSTAETTVTVSASAVDPATASDFTLSDDMTLTIAPGATTSTGTVTISAVNNTADDDNRQVTVSGAVVNTAGVTAPQDVTLTIFDDESASAMVTLTVSPTSVAEDAAGSDRTVTVTAELDGDPWPHAMEVTVSVSGGSAVAGTDYTAVRDFTITIAPGDTSGTGTFSLAPVDDILDETHETVTVTGTTNTGLSVEPASGLTVTIEDNDDPFVSTVNEDGSVTLYTGTLTIGATGVVTDSLGFRHIPGVLEGTLSPETFTYGGDLFRITRLLTDSGGGSGSADGELSLGDLLSGSLSTAESLAHWVLHLDSHTFAFADADDKHIGSSFIDWFGVTNASLGWSAGQQVAVKIVVPPPRATLVLGPAFISENSGFSTVTATLDRTSTAPTTITVSASAAEPAKASDFTLSSDTTLTIAAGQTTSTGTVTITAANNDDDDDNRQVTVSGTVVNTTGVTAPADVTLTIFDDESASTKVTLTVSPTSVAEDATGSDRTVTVTAALDGDARGQATEVTVSVTDGTAVAGTDYTQVHDFTITIDAGQTTGTGTFALAPIDDNLEESDKTVTVTGTTTSGLTVEPASGLTVTIEDDDAPAVTLVLDRNRISENVGESTVTATLNQTMNSATTVTVSASVVSPAMDSAFTLSTNKVLTIAAGQRTSTGTVTITAANNTTDDDNRQVTVSGTVVNADGVLAPEDVTLTIFDDESVSAKVTLTVSPTSVAEDATGSDRTVTVTAALDGDPLPQATRVRVSIFAVNGTANPGRDYTPVSSFTVTIKEGETSRVGIFTLAPVDDNIDEPVETVVLTGTDVTAGLPVESATLTIEDNDPTAVRLVLTQRSIGEYGGMTTVRATLGRALTEDVSIAVSATAVSPATASDFTVSSNNVLTIAPGKKTSTGTVTITANNNDAVAADDKSVTVSGVATSVEDVTQPPDLTLTIDDDDAPGMSYVPSTGIMSTATWWEPQSWESRGTLKSRDVAQSFRTGPCEDGYHLAVVSIKFRTASGGSNDRLMLTLHRRGLDGEPAESIGSNGTLRHPGGMVDTMTFDDGQQMTLTMFVPPANNPRLEPNRTYFLKLHDPFMSGVHDAMSTASVSFTANDREARTVHDHGWSIGNESFIAARSTSGWSKISDSVRMFIGFNPVDRSCKGKRSTRGGGGSDMNALPELSVSDAAVIESMDGTPRVMTFAVSVEPAPSETVTVSYETEDGTATGGAACPATPGNDGPDYVTTSGTLEFGPEVTSGDVEVTVCDDTVEDTGEDFSLVLRSTQLMAVGEDSHEVRGRGVIWNVETTTEVSIVADAAYAEEGSEAVFRLIRAGDAEQALTVPVSVVEDGAVLATPVPASVTFAPWARKAELRVPTDDDAADESDGTVTATVAAGFSWQVADGAATASVTVLDNDAAPVAGATVADVTIWSADMTAVEYGPRSIGAGSADLFSNQAGRDGLGARWLWYDPGTRKLKLAFDDGLDDAESLTLHVGDVSVGFPEHSAGDSSFTLEDVDLAWTDGETVAARVSKPSATAVSTDATLASLTVEGARLSPAFDAGVLVYRAVVDAGVETVTVSATASDGGATVVYGPGEDTDAELADHQVAVPEGETLVEVTVSAPDWKTVRSYRVVAVRAAANKAPAGLPVITGTPGVGEALSASADAVADADGVVTATYAWQWLAHDGTQDTEIEGATGTTHEVVPEQAGKTLKVRVTFTDDKGNEETLVSEATEAVVDRRPVAATLSVGDGAAEAGRFRLRIAFADAVTGLAVSHITAARVGGDAAAVSELAQAQTGRAWTAWVAAAEAGRYTVRLAGGAARSGERRSLAAVLAVDVDAQGNATAVSGPVVTSVALAQAGDGTWTDGDEVRVALVFSEPVTVVEDVGTLSVGVVLDGTTQQASYAGGTGTASLAFSYTVTADDGTVSAVTVTADSLALNGGTIRDAGGRDADLEHPGVGEAATEEVESTPAALTGLALVDTGTGAETALADGDALVLADPANGSYGLAASVSAEADVGSVLLELTGAKTVTVTDNAAPYSLYGDEDGTVTGAGLPVGSYTLSATAYAEAAGGGAALGTLAVSFRVAAGEAVDPDALTASFEGVPAEHDGSSPFTFRVRFSQEPRVSYKVLRDESFAVTGGEVDKARRVDGRNDLREIHIEPEGWDDVAVMLAGGRACGTAGAICTADGKVLANTAVATVLGPLALSVADARIDEAANAVLAFEVTLNRAASETVTVDYATADGTATAGSDYTAASGTLTFEAGETAKTVNVPVLDDVHDDTEETLTLVLSNAVGARIRDGEATGTIVNSDPLPQAWLARFGRTVAGQVVDAISGRLEGSAGSGSHVTLGGRRLILDGRGDGAGGAGPEVTARRGTGEDDAAAHDGFAALADRIGSGAGGGASTRWEESGSGDGWVHEPGDDWIRERDADGTRIMTGRELLLGSAFHLALGGDADGADVAATRWTAWGGASSSRFDGEADGLGVDGEVTAFTLGADAAWGRWLAGVAVSLSEGEGGFRDHLETDHESRGSGALASTLTSVHPYARLAVNERLTVWGILGSGTGELTLEVDNGERWASDTTMEMAAAGARGVLVPGGDGGIELAARTDARLVRMTSEAARGSDGGHLAATQSGTGRLRVLLEGSRRFVLEGGGALTPSLEVGLRHDGGDAETGSGIELGGGMSYTDPAIGLTVDAKARGLVAHEDTDYAEWGASGSVRIEPDGSGRGLALRIAPAWGADTGGAQRLWSLGDARGLGARDAAFEAESRLEAEVGYGLSVFGGRAVTTPHAAWSRAGESEVLRLGQRLKLDVSSWSVESEFAQDHRTFRAGYGYRPADFLDLGVEASRREAGNDDAAAQHDLMLRVRMRW